MDKKVIRARQRARRVAVQALYQWQLCGAEIYEIEVQYRLANDAARVDMDYFCRMLYGVTKNCRSVDAAFEPYLDRNFSDLNPIELAVLRLSTFELIHCPELAYRIILDEAVLLAKVFGSQDGFKYVNGVLNQAARALRATEMGLD